MTWTYSNAITIFLEPHGYSQNEIGLIGLIYTLSGIIAGVVASISIDS
jgi:hypothetical protein